MDKKFLDDIKNDEHLRAFGMTEENIAYAKELAKSNPIDPDVITKLVFRYQEILLLKIDHIDGSILDPKPLENDETNDLHLLWMLLEILVNEDQSDTKKHRWLGYIQGVMVMKGYITVMDEWDATRDVLNGL